MLEVVFLPLFTHEFVKSGFFLWVRFFIQKRTLHVGNDPLIGDEKPYTSKGMWLVSVNPNEFAGGIDAVL